MLSVQEGNEETVEDFLQAAEISLAVLPSQHTVCDVLRHTTAHSQREALQIFLKMANLLRRIDLQQPWITE